MVEPPNELEVNRAFTRKMNHLLCVMKVIHRFKSILVKHRNRSNTGTPKQNRDSFDASEEKAKAEVIEALLSQRRNFQSQKQKSDAGNGAPVAQEFYSQENTTPFLGIGTGTMDEFASNEATPDMVSDSPTAVDFNVYDRAYETAIENITSNPNVSTRRPTVYLTKFVQDTENLKGISELVKERDTTKPPNSTQASDSTGSASNIITHLTSKLGLSDKQ